MLDNILGQCIPVLSKINMIVLKKTTSTDVRATKVLTADAIELKAKSVAPPT
ncbi:hypothetical protein DSO57_1032760 [Entomophthora muscae]|uniref:Uncharacterized protein n=1 Tax=Entomophthora muscae TaxID=34485 RepID=A0ACC2TBC8_9FUNG|nr:hypothetical protein DSO57_1032760 [Entomophthora muscae]